MSPESSEKKCRPTREFSTLLQKLGSLPKAKINSKGARPQILFLLQHLQKFMDTLTQGRKWETVDWFTDLGWKIEYLCCNRKYWPKVFLVCEVSIELRQSYIIVPFFLSSGQCSNKRQQIMIFIIALWLLLLNCSRIFRENIHE